MKAIQLKNPFSFLRATPNGSGDIQALINLFPQSVVIGDLEANTIFACNSKALQFTAYTRAELEAKPLTKLFPDIDPSINYQPGENIQLSISHRNGVVENIIGSISPLDTEKRRILVLFEPIARVLQRERSSYRQRNHMLILQKLAHAIQESNSEEINITFLEAGHILSGAGALALYRADPGEPLLVKIQHFGSDLELPENILASEIGRSGKPQLWSQGKRIRSGLHRIAWAANLSYLASAGVGDDQALFGLLVAADDTGIPDDNLITILEVLASLLSNLFQQEVLTSQLRRINEQQVGQLKVFESLYENVQDGVIILDEEFRIISLNPSIELTLGYASHEIRGQQVEDILIGTDNIAQALKLAYEGISTPNLGNTALHRRDGRAFPAQIQITPVQEDGKVEKIIVLVRDQSEHQQIKVRTQQLEQRALLGEVTAIFAHEVRNPVNNISMALQLMDMKLPPEDELREMVDRMKQDTDRLAHLMDSVLTFTRFTDYKLEPLDIGGFLERLLQRWQPRLSRVAIGSELFIAPETPLVRGNEKPLEQVFTNLFSNALRAMSEYGGTLSVRVTPEGSPDAPRLVKIDVSDTGIGIPPENLDSIFNPFFTTDPQGTGLGLSITQRIITAHKGTIQVESFAGGGTVFHIWLPAITQTNNQN